MTETARFREYVTSGAFKLSLSRAQISSLSMIAACGDTNVQCGTAGALYQKGLADTIRSQEIGLEYRLTGAGALALKMCVLAGLVNGDDDPVAAEVNALRAQLGEARRIAHQLADDCHDMMARADEADRALADAKAMVNGMPPPQRPMVTLKDRHPLRTTKAMIDHLDAATAKLKGET